MLSARSSEVIFRNLYSYRTRTLSGSLGISIIPTVFVKAFHTNAIITVILSVCQGFINFSVPLLHGFHKYSIIRKTRI